MNRITLIAALLITAFLALAGSAFGQTNPEDDPFYIPPPTEYRVAEVIDVWTYAPVNAWASEFTAFTPYARVSCVQVPKDQPLTVPNTLRMLGPTLSGPKAKLFTDPCYLAYDVEGKPVVQKVEFPYSYDLGAGPKSIKRSYPYKVWWGDTLIYSAKVTVIRTGYKPARTQYIWASKNPDAYFNVCVKKGYEVWAKNGDYYCKRSFAAQSRFVSKLTQYVTSEPAG